MRYITIHCAATREGKYFDRTHIKKWHLQRGFYDIGYHYVVLLDGSIQKGRGDNVQGAHVKGYNKKNIGICYIGGLDKNGDAKDTRTPQQKESLINLLQELKDKYPNVKIQGHRDFSKDLNNNGIIESFEFIKECPCFNAKKEYKDI